MTNNRAWIVFGFCGLMIVGITLWMRQQSTASPLTPTAAALSLLDSSSVVTPTSASTPTPAATATPSLISVYVSGAVQSPGVYALPQAARVNDAVQAAGGFTISADPVRINLAAHLADAQQIYVPELHESSPPPVASASAPNASAASDTSASGRVNINTASASELEQLPNIGPTTAKRIVDYRDDHGPFMSIEDLRSVRGIGPATYADLEPYISVGD